MYNWRRTDRRRQCLLCKVNYNFLASNFQLNCCYRVGRTAPAEEKKGILQDSAIYDLPHVDFVWGLPLDIFHLGYEGITKKMLERMFTKRTTKQSKAYLTRLNYYYTKMKVFSESARKARTIKVKNLKGNELGLITLSVLPVIALHVIDSKKPVR